MTNEQLQVCTKKELVEQAKKLGITDPAHMRKEDLVRAITRALKKKPLSEPTPPPTPPKSAPTPAPNGKPAPAPRAKSVPVPPAPKPTPSAKPAAAPTSANRTTTAPTTREASEPKPRPQKSAARDVTEPSTPTTEQESRGSKFDTGVPTRDLSARAPKNLPNGYGKDRIVVMVRDPFWLHVYWEMTHQSVQRAEAALALDWHGAKPILRLYDVSSQDTTSTAETPLRDIEIHGGVNSWYIEAPNPPRQFRVDIGYVSRRGQFFALAHSNIARTPAAGVSDVVDENWADIDSRQADRIFSMSNGFDPSSGGSLELKQLLEERFRRPMSSPLGSSTSSPAAAGKPQKFFFEIDAELIVYGRTEPHARVTLQGEPIKLRPDGTFTLQYSLPNSRQIIPAVAASADGVEERTVILAIERNTRQLEPMIHDMLDE